MLFSIDCIDFTYTTAVITLVLEKHMSPSLSPFRYPGGKFYARKILLDFIPSHTTYAETFVGGGQVFFTKKKSLRNILNDIDPDLIATYKTIRDNPFNLIRSLANETVNRERHKFYKTMKPEDEFQMAKRWFYLNRTSYSGILSEKGCYLGYKEGISIPPEGWGKLILEASKFLQGVEITCMDFEDAIATYQPGTFAFLDPPYFNAARELYAYEFDLNDHKRLANLLYERRHDFKFLLSYDDAPEIRHLYEWANITEHSWRYSIRYSQEEDRQAEEIFINNFSYVKI